MVIRKSSGYLVFSRIFLIAIKIGYHECPAKSVGKQGEEIGAKFTKCFHNSSTILLHDNPDSQNSSEEGRIVEEF
jgi:hypothetical protein